MSARIRWTGGSPEAAIQKVVFAQVRDNVAARLRDMRCPEHGTRPTSVDVTGHNLDSLKWEIHGCCAKLREAAAQAFKN